MALDKIPFICEQCGKSFSLAPWLIRQGQKGRFCSRQCNGIAIRTKTVRACEFCGTEFLANKGRFCSTVCYHTSGRNRVSCVCENCQTAFECPLSQAPRRFCSHKCSGEYFCIPLEERFKKFIGPTTETGCVLWIGGDDGHGYGVIWSGPPANSTLKAHRVAFEFAGGIIPPEHEVLHHCDNPPCIFYGHLFTGTHLDNMKDMVSKDRHARGERNNFAKLTEDQAREVISRSAAGEKIIPSEYDITLQSVWNLLNGRTWKHLNEVRIR